jgi:tRNA modification GTPase
LLGEKPVLVAANKSDLPQKAALDELPWPVVSICALTGDGVAELEERMVSTVFGGKVFTSDALLVSNPRHKEALERAERHVAQAQTSLEANMPDDFITIDLTAALSALGEVTGETIQDELLETIFSQFCIGK